MYLRPLGRRQAFAWASVARAPWMARGGARSLAPLMKYTNTSRNRLLLVQARTPWAHAAMASGL